MNVVSAAKSTQIETGEDYADLREAVGAICRRFPGPYWQQKDSSGEYPHEFVDELTKGGFLAALRLERPEAREAAEKPRQFAFWGRHRNCSSTRRVRERQQAGQRSGAVNPNPAERGR